MLNGLLRKSVSRSFHRTLNSIPIVLTATVVLVLPSAPRFFAQAGKPVESNPESRSKGDVAAVLEALRLSVERLRSIEYEAKYRVEQHVPLAKGTKAPFDRPFVLNYEIQYKGQGNLFRSRSVMTSSLDDKKREKSYSYDGVDHRRLDGTNKVLDIRKKTLPVNPPTRTGVLQPITAPFAFAFEGKPYEFTTLLNRSTWDRLTEVASLESEEQWNGRSCSILVVERTRYGVRYRFKVFLDKTRDDYPVRTVVTDTESTTDTRVILTTVATELGPVQVPLEIHSRTRNNSGEPIQSSDYEIDPASLKVNVAIPRAAFTLDEKKATEAIRYIDERRVVKPESTRPVPRPQTRVSILLAVNVLIVVFALLLGAYLRFKRKAS